MRNVNEFFTATDLLICSFFIHISNCNKLDGYSPDPDDFYQGRYTRDIRSSSAELLIPRRVHEDGAFRTYELPKFYERHETDEQQRRRRRRSSSSADRSVHLVLPFANEDHHVELAPYHEFISPWLVIEKRSAALDAASLLSASFERPSSLQCHYRGRLRRHASSRAALSLCDGVTGYLQTDRGRYFIEPLHGDEPDADGQHVHVIYKKEAPHENAGRSSGPFCGTSDDWEGAWTERLQRAAAIDDGRGRVTGPAAALTATHSLHRYVEVALVADRRFLDFHANTSYEQYLLTVMNMVSDFYHDASCGNQMDVVVVRMIFLERQKDEMDLHISPNAEKTLESFASWIEKLNPIDPEHPNHFDIGALVTRYDICAEGNNCNLLGLAYVAAACERKKAACINEDSGLLLGIVMAHEIGHTSGLGNCLNNNPKNPPAKYRYPDMLPGAMYDADFQCKLAYPGSTPCHFGNDDCKDLWCNAGGNNCKSKGTPPADGTKCGENKWCIHKKCVEMGSRGDAANGGWGDWGRPGACSRTCGGGVQYAERECDNPAPRNGGRYCIGERKKFSVCNTKPCDASRPSFRAVQCAEYNGKKVLPGGPHKWEPFLRDDLEVCALYCVNRARTFIKLSPTAKDGTPCKPGTYHMCIGGVCRKVGCDWVIDSDAVEDICGVCNGGGTQCNKVEGDYREVGKPGYVTIVKIPKGSKSIKVFEYDEHVNTLAIKLEKKNQYCLNGNSKEQANGDYKCAGATITYNHVKNQLEEAVIRGPLKEPIEVQYIFYKLSNPGVHYEYYVDAPDTSYVPKYSWEFLEWSDCDAKCGGGTKISEASCTEARAGKVALEFCKDTPRPAPKSQMCNEAPCPAKWRVSQWSRCSGCGGKPGKMHRKIQCVRPGAHMGDDYVQLNFEACEGKLPIQMRDCIGSEPCRKPCSTNITTGTKIPGQLRYELIDDLVDYGLARYLEKSRGVSIEEESEGGEEKDDGDDLEKMLKDWAHEEEEEKKEKNKKRACNGNNCSANFTTPVPGSVIIDSVPQSEIVVYEVPLVRNRTLANMSDVDFQKQGDQVFDDSLDVRREKIYRGGEAIKHLNELTKLPNGKNESLTNARETRLAKCARRSRRRRRPAKRKSVVQ